MNRRLIHAAQNQLSESIFAIEQTHRKKLTPAARIMLEAILLEALTTREEEWGLRMAIFPEPANPERIRNVIKESFASVVADACYKESAELITTRDLLAAIQGRWCGIFPIC